MDKEMLEKIKETFDCAVKLSSLVLPLLIMNPDMSKTLGITVEDVLYLNKNYYEINEYLKEMMKSE